MELRTPDDERDRGQVGIGTLIVFIAMVLVAAIAAGVLINTAGFLQTKSQETGQQSGKQVTNRLQLNSVTSQNVSEDPEKVATMNATASRAPGASTINLKTVSVQWVGPHTVKTLKWGPTANSENFTTAMLKNAGGGSDYVLNSDADLVRLSFSAWQVTNRSGVDPGDTVTLRVTTASNGRTVRTISVPDSLVGKDVVSL